LLDSEMKAADGGLAGKALVEVFQFDVRHS
jgi:hypothetical protein